MCFFNFVNAANAGNKNRCRFSLELNKENVCLAMGPGLVVMGGDSCSRGPEFESQHCILDEHLFILICCKHCIDV